MSVPAIAASGHVSVRWVYKALHHLSYYGYVYLIPAPGPDGAAEGDDEPSKAEPASKAERVVCLRIPAPGSMPVKTYDPAADASLPPREDADWSGTGVAVAARRSAPRGPAPDPAAEPAARGEHARSRSRGPGARRGMATPNLKALEKVPASNFTVFRRVVTAGGGRAFWRGQGRPSALPHAAAARAELLP